MNLLVFIKKEKIAEVMMALANQFPKSKIICYQLLENSLNLMRLNRFSP
jgi:uncharacterized alpha-E superfamily protein